MIGLKKEPERFTFLALARQGGAGGGPNWSWALSRFRKWSNMWTNSCTAPPGRGPLHRRVPTFTSARTSGLTQSSRGGLVTSCVLVDIPCGQCVDVTVMPYSRERFWGRNSAVSLSD